MPRLTAAQRKAFAALERSYRAELQAKLQTIAVEAASLRAASWDEDRVATLYRLVHCVAGSAAIYGFDEVSREAHELEQLVGLALDRRNTEEIAAQVPARVEALVQTALTRSKGPTARGKRDR